MATPGTPATVHGGSRWRVPDDGSLGSSDMLSRSPDDEAGERPFAFVVKAPGADISEDDVKSHISGTLSSYKQLGGVEFRDAIPKSASGKILRRDLRD